jgi:hypothetical protein
MELKMSRAVNFGRWLLMLGVCSGLSRAETVLYTNDFSKGLDSNWRSEVGLDLSVTDDSAGIGGGNALQITCTAGLREAGFKFIETALSAPGDYIEFSYDIRFPNLADRLNVSFLNDIGNNSRLNFSDTDFFGFTLQLRLAANSVLYQYTSPYVVGAIKGYPYKAFSAMRTGLGTKAHSQKVRFTRADDKTVKASVFLDGTSVMDWEIASPDYFTFGLRPVVAGDVILLDNIIIKSGSGTSIE